MTNIIQPLTRAQIYQLVCGLLFGFQMDSTVFNNFLDQSQAIREGARPWRILQAVDSSLSAGPGTNFLTPFTIAPTNSDFKRWSSDKQIVLTDAQNNPIVYQEVPIADKFQYQKINGYFYCDYAAGLFYLCGTLPQSYTINQFYIKQMPAVSYTPDGVSYPNVWLFPAWCHKILAFDIALMYKQIDYDIINLQNAAQLQLQATNLFDQMTRWDSDLQRNASQGVDPFGGPTSWSGNSSGGTIGRP